MSEQQEYEALKEDKARRAARAAAPEAFERALEEFIEERDLDLDFDRLYGDNPQTYIAYLCRINLGDLSYSLSRHPSLYAYAMALYETARVEEARAKSEYEKAYNQVFSQLREKRDMAIGHAERAAETHEVVVEMTRRHIEAKRKVAPLKSLIAGLEHRRDMLVQISSRQKHELRHT